MPRTKPAPSVRRNIASLHQPPSHRPSSAAPQARELASSIKRRNSASASPPCCRHSCAMRKAHLIGQVLKQRQCEPPFLQTRMDKAPRLTLSDGGRVMEGHAEEPLSCLAP